MVMQGDLKELLKSWRQEAKRTGTFPPLWQPEQEGEALFGLVVEIRKNPWQETGGPPIFRIKGWKITPNDGLEDREPKCYDAVGEVLKNEMYSKGVGVGDWVFVQYLGRAKRAKGGRQRARLYGVTKVSEEEVSRFLSIVGITKEEFEAAVQAEATKAPAQAEIPPPGLMEQVVEYVKLWGEVTPSDLMKFLENKGFNVTLEDVVKWCGLEVGEDGMIRIKKEA